MNSTTNGTSDEQITQAIERSIQARMQSHAPPINVAVQGSTVTITGHVANQATKDAINNLARDTTGVLNVTDNLVIGGGHPFLDWLLPGRDSNKDLEQQDRGDW
jgi:osmotically-inducible protein OsmY